MSAPASSQQASGPASPHEGPGAPPASSAADVPGGTAASVMKSRAGAGLPAALTDPALLHRLIRSLPASSFPDPTLPASGSDGNRHRPRPRRRVPQPHKSTSITTPWNDTLSPMSSQLPVPQPGRPATNAPTEDDVELPPEPRGLLRTLSRWYHRHPTIIDISIAAGVVAYSLIVAIPLLLRPSSPARTYPILPLALIAIALMGVALSLRRRFPLWCWAAILLIPETYQFAVLQAFHLNTEQLIYAAIGISGMGLISITIALGAVASHRKPSAAWTAGGISLVVLVMDVILTNPGLTVGEILRNAAILILLILVGILVGFNTRSARLRLKAIELRSARLALASEQAVLLAAAEERSRIAREMHDVVAHSLAVMITMADGAAAIVERDPATAKQAIETLAEAGRSALADTRRLVGVLREDPSVAAEQAPQSPEPPAPSEGSPSSARQQEVRDLPVPEFAPLGTVTPVEPSAPIANLRQQATDGAGDRSRGDLPLAPSPEQADITELVKRFVAAGVPVTYRWVGAALPADKALQLTVFRIAQEALTNVLRYAPTTPAVSVDVERHVGTVVLTVDNEAAPGTRPMHGSGKGLIGMRERASVYGGTVQAGPTPTGWRVRAVLRWDEHDEGTFSWQTPL
ncbi:histidine kinase [Actinomyces viscosus]|uniref:histidine kinase n=1 Tax=Actinomyces viscosus TaxID=1656 RepID=A0ABT7TYQ6_ACTVI|nr:histidine kinase [Actinomyces viscosus]MDM8076967.1 histidine kinase [Actinomyces viscosus]